MTSNKQSFCLTPVKSCRSSQRSVSFLSEILPQQHRGLHITPLNQNKWANLPGLRLYVGNEDELKICDPCSWHNLIEAKSKNMQEGKEGKRRSEFYKGIISIAMLTKCATNLVKLLSKLT